MNAEGSNRTGDESGPVIGNYDEQTALIVIDVQNDFADPEGNLYVPGGDEVLDVINREISAARQRGAFVVYTQDSHPESTPHFEKDGGVWPVHCVQGTWGWEFHPRLDADQGPVIRKGTDGSDGYSGFSVRDPESGEEAPTELDAVLREHGVQHVVVCGLAEDVCVKETVLDARRLGYPATLLAAATAAVNLQPGQGFRAAAAMARAGADVV